MIMGSGSIGSVGFTPNGHTGPRWPCGPHTREGELGRGRSCEGRRGGVAGWAASGFQPIRLGKIENSFSILFYKF
jgi:hypothetical protein